LPVQHRITYKLCLMMHLVNIGRAPTYLINSVTATRDVVSRSRLQEERSPRRLGRSATYVNRPKLYATLMRRYTVPPYMPWKQLAHIHKSVSS